MPPVPRMSWILPLRRRFQFTTNFLPTIFAHAERGDHEIVVVLDRCPLRHELEHSRTHEGWRAASREAQEQVIVEGIQAMNAVTRWFDRNAKLCESRGIKVLVSKGSESCWTGGARTAAALDVGIAAASSDWVIWGDEDFILSPGWDRALADCVEGRDPMKTVGVISMVMPRVEPEPWPMPWSGDWIRATHRYHNSQFAFPVKAEHSEAQSARISMDTWLAYARAASEGGITEEPANRREFCHWVPMLLHRDLWRSVGGFALGGRLDYEKSLSFDIHFDDALGAAGVTKRMRRDNLVLHAKHPAWISAEADRLWGAPQLLKAIEKAVIL